MSYLALYRKYRPDTFSKMVGQTAVIQALQNQVKYNQVGHAYLFCGTRGTGKTSTAKVFARAVNCLNPKDGNPCNECELCREAESGFNLVEIDAASNNGVENIRDLREEVQYTPSKGKYKVYIIDEVHMLTQSAFNALLKTLEEPPEHVIFVLATTEPHKVLPTILSRCQRYDFKRITTSEIADHLLNVCEQEGIEAEKDALQYIAAIADGGMRDALSILDQCHAYYMHDSITLAKVRDVLGAVDTQIFTQITDALVQQNAGALLQTVDQVFAEGRDALQFITAWNGYLRNVLVSRVLADKGNGLIEADPEQLERIQKQAHQIPAELLTYYIEELAKLEAKLKGVTQKRVILEVGLIRLLKPEEEKPIRMTAPVREVVREVVREIPVEEKSVIKPKEEERKPVSVAPRSSENIAPSGGLAKVIAKWPEIRKKILVQWPSFYTLNLMRLEPGRGDDELVLKSPKAIYCTQLEMKDGEKLKLIADQIQETTGIQVRLKTVSEERQKVHSGDLSDIMNQ
ncbi:MAG: DNA polymerase III subunit gamma/tau, partial [Lachnospiraceae bacterium]|nr:DNA polymerase III subunit gamma/tau [Lachnospiraceae bacterium]